MLNKVQYSYVINNYQNNPDLVALSREAFNDPQLDAHSPETKAVRSVVSKVFAKPLFKPFTKEEGKEKLKKIEAQRVPIETVDRVHQSKHWGAGIEEVPRQKLSTLLKTGVIFENQIQGAKRINSCFIKHMNNEQVCAANLFGQMLLGKTGTSGALAALRTDLTFLYTTTVRDKAFFKDNIDFFERNNFRNVHGYAIDKLLKYFDEVVTLHPQIDVVIFDEAHYGAMKNSVMDNLIKKLENKFPKIFFLFITATPVHILLHNWKSAQLRNKFQHLPIIEAPIPPTYSGISEFLQHPQVIKDHRPTIEFLVPRKADLPNGQLSLGLSKRSAEKYDLGDVITKSCEHLLNFDNGAVLCAMRKAHKNISKEPTQVGRILYEVMRREYLEQGSPPDNFKIFFIASDGNKNREIKKLQKQQFALAPTQELKDKIAYALKVAETSRVFIIFVDTLKAGYNLGAPTKDLIRWWIDPYKTQTAIVQALPGRACGHGRTFWDFGISCNINALRMYESYASNPHSVNKEEISQWCNDNSPTPLATGVSANMGVAPTRKPVEEYIISPYPMSHFDSKGDWVRNYGEESGNNTYMRNTSYIKEITPLYPERPAAVCSPEHLFGSRRDIAKYILENTRHGGEARFRVTKDPSLPSPTATDIADILVKYGKKDCTYEEIQEESAEYARSIENLDLAISNIESPFLSKIVKILNEGKFSTESKLNIGLPPEGEISPVDVIQMHNEGRLFQVAISLPISPEESVRPVSISEKPNIYNEVAQQ